MPVNAVGREVPSEINGVRFKPFAGDGKTPPEGRRAGSLIRMAPKGRSKIVNSLEEVIRKVGLEDGMTVSFHHHLRNGDFVVNMVMETIHRMGIKDIRLAPTALFPVHEPLVPMLKDGTIRRIEGSMNGPVGEATSYGAMKEVGILRSHSGRVRAVESGEIHIDVAFIAAPTADPYGNLNGVDGPSACGPLAYAMVDAYHADHVVAITDHLVPYPAHPISIYQHNVDYVVPVDKIGDPKGIMSGTLRITTSPSRLKIARYALEVIERVALKPGFSFQAGAGGISLAVTKFLGDVMRKKGIKASFINGGVTKYVVEMLHEGLVDVVLDGQAFDLDAVKSLKEDRNHIETPLAMYGNPYSSGGIVNMLDAGVLGATEVDIDFNVNVNTHSDGLLLHGIGGHQEVAAGSALTIITVPLYRYRVPVVRERVTTVTTPGEVVDVVVTEYGIAINPKRDDIIEAMRGSKVPIWDIQDLQKKAYQICGKPQEPKTTDDIIAAILWRDGTIIDVVYKVKK